jgi:hypothetical protein
LFLIRWAVEELRRQAKPRTIKWFDVAAGCVMFVDAVHRYNVHKGFQPAHLLILAGFITILRGIFVTRLPGRRRVVLRDEGVFAHTALFRTLSLSWSDIQKIERGPFGVVFILGNERKRLNLKRIENRTEVIDRIAGAATGQGIPVVDVV